MNPFLPSPLKLYADKGRTALAVFLFILTSGCMTYRVDSLADAPDADPGDRRCERAISGDTRTGGPDGLCTLRAAVMESNASIWKDTIEVPGGFYQLLPFDAGGGHLLITDGVKIQGAGATSTILDGNNSDMVLYVDRKSVV